MDLYDFAKSLGLILPGHIPHGWWFRVPTKDHPRKKNGAIFFGGDFAHLCNWEDGETQTWMEKGPKERRPDPGLARRMAEARTQNDRERRVGWAKAAEVARELIATATRGEHDYLRSKGFPRAEGLVSPEGVLIIPMRDVSSASVLRGVQRIRATDDGGFEKKMLPGMRAKEAVYCIGDPRAKETWLCEGYATGLSLDAALSQMRLSANVLVCFSDGNLVTVSSMIGGTRYVYADNDQSGAGEAAARRTGLPWCMSDTVGEDANDEHVRAGIFSVRAKIMELRARASGL